MTPLSSLRSRIFLASALLAVLTIGVAMYLVSIRVTAEAERTLEREVASTAALVDQLLTTRTETFAQMARFIADAPQVKAAVDTNDPPTVQNIANGYLKQVGSNVLCVTNARGDMLATVGPKTRGFPVGADHPAITGALRGRESFSLLPQPDGVLQLVTVPIALGLSYPQILGTLSVGFLLDNALAAQLKTVAGGDIAFGMSGQVVAATLPLDTYPDLADRLRTPALSHLTAGGQDFVALPQTLAAAYMPAGTGPVALILRSQTEQLRFLRALHTTLGVMAVVAVIVSTLLSFAVARTITRPLAAITGVMREVAATGDLTRRIGVGRGSRWDDADARLLAATFNTLTDSIARFQREISQKERLTSLGRLSTVIAHEVRNPLMIIKATLHSLRQSGTRAVDVQDAVSDIEEEVGRLNRIVNEVLDFARPIRFELAATDLNALCRDSAVASEKGGPGDAVRLDLDPALPAVTTDGERLRIALVNMLVNARAAVKGAVPTDSNLAPVTLKTAVRNGHAAITIQDCGAGIGAADLPHVFDPYFTTKRGGTGLGLPIAKSIIEGLGGSLRVSSVVGRGTDIDIEIPIDSSVH